MASNKDDDARQKKALANAEKLMKAYDELGGKVNKQNDGWNSISNAILGINKSEFFEKIKDSTTNISDMKEHIGMLSEAFNEASESANKGFNSVFKSIRGGGISVNESIASMTNKLSESMPEIAKQIQDAFDSKNLASLSPLAMREFQKMVKDKEGFGKLSKFFESDAIKKIKDINEELLQTHDRLKKGGIEVLNIGRGLDKWTQNFAKHISPQKIVDSLMVFDDKLSDIQRKFSVLGNTQIKATSEAMSSLVVNGAKFGVSTEDSFKNVEQLANSLKTNNIPAVTELAKQFQEIPGALGVTGEEVNNIVGSMKFLGDSTEDIKNMFTNIAKTSALYGVNVSKVTSEIAKELPKWQKMGFKEGEASLVRFAAKAEKLGISMDSILKVSDAFQMNLENSIDSAAQLQLVGGSFANVDPFSLMSAAQEGGEAMTDMVSKLGADIGHFNENGEFKITPVDRKRLAMASEALHLSLDEMTTMVSQAALKNKKIDLLGTSLQGLTLEEQEFVTNLSNIGDDNKIKLDIGGVTDLSKLTPTMIKSAMEKSKADAADLDARNIANQSMKQSFDSFVNSLLSTLTVFEPVLKFLGLILNKITSAFSWISKTFGESIGAMTALGVALYFAFGSSGFTKLLSALNPANFVEGIKSFSKGGIAGIFRKEKNVEESVTPDLASKAAGPSPGVGDGLKSLAKGLSAMGNPKVFAGLGAVALAGPAFLLFIPALPGLLIISLIGTMDKLIVRGFKAIASGVGAMGGNISQIALGALAMAIIGAAFIPFAFGLSLLKGLDWKVVGIATLAFIGLGIAMALMAPLAIPILITAAAFAIAAGGFLLFGLAIGQAAIGFNAMSTVDWSSISGMGPALLIIAAAGALGLVGSFGILGMAFSLGALASVMIVLAPALQMASNSMNSMATGIEKLNSAVKSIDTAKLESLASSSERLNTASAISGLSNVVSGIFGGGKSENTQTIKLEPITVNLRLNGRDIQSFIIEDTKLVS